MMLFALDGVEVIYTRVDTCAKFVQQLEIGGIYTNIVDSVE
jgi:hypothetical protein